ncbi:Catechol-2,3-dioxygenase [compost metagenome]
MHTTEVLPKGLKLGAVQLRVSHLERSLAFYQDTVGFRVLRREEGRAELTVDGVSPLLILREVGEGEGQRRRSAAGLYHFAILLPDRPSLGLVLRNLIASGIEIGQGDHLVSEALYIQDPDNNGIELYRDRPRDTWQYDPEGHVVMGTDPVDVEGLLSDSEGLQWNGLPAGTVIGHVHFHVGNLKKAQDFYCGVLGFELVARYGGSALFVSAGGYHHHIGLNVWAGEGAKPASPNAPGIDYFTIQLPSEEDRSLVLRRLEDAGFGLTEFEGEPGVHDPWHIGIRLVAAEGLQA